MLLRGFTELSSASSATALTLAVLALLWSSSTAFSPALPSRLTRTRQSPSLLGAKAVGRSFQFVPYGEEFKGDGLTICADGLVKGTSSVPPISHLIFSMSEGCKSSRCCTQLRRADKHHDPRSRLHLTHWTNNETPRVFPPCFL